MVDVSIATEVLKGIPSQVAIMIIGMTPIFELRGSIPVAIGLYKMSVPSAYFWSVIGNIVPTVLIVLLLDKVVKILSTRFEFFDKFFQWLFDRTRKRAQDKIEKYGPWGLFVLVAIPLPVTGGWTGALAAFLFGIEKKKSIPIIVLGIMVAGVIVTLLTVGVVSLPI
ncbi:MAG: small multi-drug export protein [Patescibacteria group bacterium]|nr:small multi-drug export protein [Patescibacteria group bacterium]